MIHRCGQKGPPSAAGAYGGPPPAQWWHGPLLEHHYVIASAVGRAQTKPQREGRVLLTSWTCCSELFFQ